jgi:hypothetical protein
MKAKPKKVTTRVLVANKTQLLTCPLTDEEFMLRAHHLALVCQDIENEEDRQSQIKADMKAALAKLEAEQSRLTLIVARKAEVRDVLVDIIADDVAGEAITVRQDTGEIIHRRQLEPAERQLPLDLEARS